MTNLPRDEWPQYHYPRLHGYSVGEDGEVTVHLCLGLPCCGLDLLVEHPASMTALELYQIAGEFCAMHRRVRELPSFNVCAVNGKGTALQDDAQTADLARLRTAT